ncbi:MAG: DoxX family protein [Muribaculaceae bacterium]|nr:DoxX family protein [Muribaculaceae bacterium]
MRTSSLSGYIKRYYFRFTGYSYANMGRLFLRLFIGIMLMQFGVRQISNFDILKEVFPGVIGMTSHATLIVMICIEIVCSTFIMFGFLTRLMIIPPFVSMVLAEYYILHDYVAEKAYLLDWQQIGYVPVLFMGIYFFLLLVGPGKISVDYFLSLHIIHTENKSEGELEEV